MLLFSNPSADPAYNQAFEEVLFTHRTQGEILLLWQNAPAVVCGRYQNVFAEINVPAALEQKVSVIRRETGGGTVYHDPGNLNYTFITDAGEGLDYGRFLSPVVNALRALGVPAETGRICDITVAGKKVSGSAQKVAGGRVLHHGTLLFSADLDRLRLLANGAKAEYVSKGVQSSPWPVANLSEYLPGMTLSAFCGSLTVLLTAGKMPEQANLTLDELSEVNRLTREKYRAWDWTYGKNPAYTLTRPFPGGTLHLESRHGIIEALEGPDENLCRRLIGRRLDVQTLCKEIPEAAALLPYLF